LLLEEMALRADKDSQQSFMVRITDNLFSRNSLSDIRRLYWLKSARWMLQMFNLIIGGQLNFKKKAKGGPLSPTTRASLRNMRLTL
jgi:hypothetical protein